MAFRRNAARWFCNPHFRKRKQAGTSGPSKRPSSSLCSTRSMPRTKVRSRDSVVSFIILPYPVEGNESHVSAKRPVRNKNRGRRRPVVGKSIMSLVCFINGCKMRYWHLSRNTEKKFLFLWVAIELYHADIYVTRICCYQSQIY